MRADLVDDDYRPDKCMLTAAGFCIDDFVTDESSSENVEDEEDNEEDDWFGEDAIAILDSFGYPIDLSKAD